jgi:hypothetical protein
VSFGLDGVALEIELNEKRAADVRTRLDPVALRRRGANRDRNAATRHRSSHSMPLSRR